MKFRSTPASLIDSNVDLDSIAEDWQASGFIGFCVPNSGAPVAHLFFRLRQVRLRDKQLGTIVGYYVESHIKSHSHRRSRQGNITTADAASSSDERPR